jgi:NIPSNAP
MITCVVEYVIDPAKIEAFERFGRRWIELVDSHGGMHHGYFLPAEGASDKALALFSFPSLAAYEQYRALFGSDPDFIEADRIRCGAERPGDLGDQSCAARRACPRAGVSQTRRRLR